MIAQGHESVHQLFTVTDSLAEMFMRTESMTILSALHYTDALVKEAYLGDTFLMKLIILADSYKKPDRFWEIWNSYRPLVSEMASGWGKQQLRTYTLNIEWNDGVTEGTLCVQKTLVSLLLWQSIVKGMLLYSMD